MNKLLIICGPTATGKTSLGIKLAQKFKGEIISADSRQVYKGMDIGTGKDLPKKSKLIIKSQKSEIEGKPRLGHYLFDTVPVWLLDIVEPGYRFSAANYIRCARLVLRDIFKRKKLPILVGGTGFYLRSLLEGLPTLGITPDWELRKKLATKTPQTLEEKLKKLDPKRWQKMNPADRKNPRRLIRAIEVARNQTGEIGRPQSLNVDHLAIVLTAPYPILDQRIDQRVKARVKQGVVTEIKSLLKKGFSWDNSVLGQTIGYQEFQPFFEKKATLAEVIQKWKNSEHAYARRQKTWFKKAFPDQNAWFDTSQPGFEEKIRNKVKNWFTISNSNSP